MLDPQVGAVDVVLTETGQPGHRSDRLDPLGRRQSVAAREDPRIVARRIRLRLGEERRQPATPLPAVEVRRRGVCREVERVGPVVALLLEVDGAQVQDARDEHDPVEVHAVASLQVLGESSRTKRSVRLAGEELRRHPAVVARRPEADDLRDGLQIALEPVINLGFAALDRPGVSRRHRVDEDEVAHAEQRLGIVGQPVRRRQQAPDVTHEDPSRPEQSQVQPDAGRSWAAVEREGDRPLRRLRFVQHIGRDRDLGLRAEPLEDAVLVHLLAEDEASGDSGVAQRPPPDPEGMRRGDEVVGRLGRPLGHFCDGLCRGL